MHIFLHKPFANLKKAVNFAQKMYTIYVHKLRSK